MKKHHLDSSVTLFNLWNTKKDVVHSKNDILPTVPFNFGGPGQIYLLVSLPRMQVRKGLKV